MTVTNNGIREIHKTIEKAARRIWRETEEVDRLTLYGLIDPDDPSSVKNMSDYMSFLHTALAGFDMGYGRTKTISEKSINRKTLYGLGLDESDDFGVVELRDSSGIVVDDQPERDKAKMTAKELRNLLSGVKTKGVYYTALFSDVFEIVAEASNNGNKNLDNPGSYSESFDTVDV